MGSGPGLTLSRQSEEIRETSLALLQAGPVCSVHETGILGCYEQLNPLSFFFNIQSRYSRGVLRRSQHP